MLKFEPEICTYKYIIRTPCSSCITLHWKWMTSGLWFVWGSEKAALHCLLMNVSLCVNKENPCIAHTQTLIIHLVKLSCSPSTLTHPKWPFYCGFPTGNFLRLICCVRSNRDNKTLKPWFMIYSSWSLHGYCGDCRCSWVAELIKQIQRVREKKKDG